MSHIYGEIATTQAPKILPKWRRSRFDIKEVGKV